MLICTTGYKTFALFQLSCTCVVVYLSSINSTLFLYYIRIRDELMFIKLVGAPKQATKPQLGPILLPGTLFGEL